jgi:TolB protein
MKLSYRWAPIAAILVCAAPAAARAQDTTFRGITIGANYDPLRSKLGVVVLPVTGAFGDSIRAIIQRDLDFSDRFSVISVEDAERGAFNAPGAAAGLNYALFTRLGANAVVEVTQTSGALHVALYDVAKSAAINVDNLPVPTSGLSRDWRLAVHRVSDEVTRWATGQRGIAATRVAYLRTGSIRIIDSDGASEITVPTEENGYSPAWDPTGSMLVYSTFGAPGNAPPRILLFDLATGRARTLLPPARNTIPVSPVFMPDGKSIVFSRGGENSTEIFLLSIAGGEPRRLTSGHGALNTNPTVSPNGRRIAYTSSLLGRPELYIMDADGTNQDILTDYDARDNNYRSDPDWSPDGRLVAYQEMVGGRFQVRTIPVSGGSAKLLTSEGQNDQPSWAPDGRHLVFTSDRTGAKQLWVLDTESGRVRQLTTAGGAKLAAWSPRLAAQ